MQLEIIITTYLFVYIYYGVDLLNESMETLVSESNFIRHRAVMTWMQLFFVNAY